LETGRKRLKDLVLDSICQAYNINKKWILTGEGEMFGREPPDVKLEELIDTFKGLNGYFKEYLLDQVRQLDAIQRKEARLKK